MRLRQPWVRLALCVAILTATCLPSPAADHARMALQKTLPVYSGLARSMNLRGNVILLMLIEPDGAVGNVTLESGHPILAALAITAVRQWKYAPGPITTSEVVTFTF